MKRLIIDTIVSSCLIGPKDTTILSPPGGKSNEAFCLMLQGKDLNLSTLLKEKKFRHRGHKEGALRAMKNLEDDELGKLEENGTKGSVRVSIQEPGPTACIETDTCRFLCKDCFNPLKSLSTLQKNQTATTISNRFSTKRVNVH